MIRFYCFEMFSGKLFRSAPPLFQSWVCSRRPVSSCQSQNNWSHLALRVQNRTEMPSLFKWAIEDTHDMLEFPLFQTRTNCASKAIVEVKFHTHTHTCTHTHRQLLQWIVHITVVAGVTGIFIQDDLFQKCAHVHTHKPIG